MKCLYSNELINNSKNPPEKKLFYYRFSYIFMPAFLLLPYKNSSFFCMISYQLNLPYCSKDLHNLCIDYV